jgi:leucyl/phenylalanyl-tRNA--protein transferase
VSGTPITWLSPSDPPEAFPDVERALIEPDGLLAAGGDLSSERLLAAYRRGIFPWYEESQPILWWSPNPRCILRPDSFHVAKRLQRQIRRSPLTVSFNSAFPQVIRACADDRASQTGTWITPQMLSAYEQLHDEGWAHSIEVMDGNELVGGVYGLCIGRVFFGESMFSAQANASKIALLALTKHMLASGMPLTDCQVLSPHLLTLGATTMPRAEFVQTLNESCEPANKHQDWPLETIEAAKLLHK